MADRSYNETDPVLFGERLATSQMFSTLFREGMALVEETAAYLDTDGRSDAKALQRHAALAYATESMRLTTRLMQLASWLLLHRAVSEGEMSLAQARKEKARVKVGLDHRDEDSENMLPERLRDLIAHSLRIQERVRRLDVTIHSPPPEALAANPVERQLGLLRAAFPGAK
jgi:regulator of CtrA degradation